MRIMRVSSGASSWLYLLDTNGKILEVADEIRDAKRVDGWIEKIQPLNYHHRMAIDHRSRNLA